MAIIDPHHHLWDLNSLWYPWLNEEDKTAFFVNYAPLAKNYTVFDYLADTRNQGLQQYVHLQMNQAQGWQSAMTISRSY